MKPQTIDLHVTIEELYHGCIKSIRFTRTVACPCTSTPSSSHNVCNMCSGKGVISRVTCPFTDRITVTPILCHECEGSGEKVVQECKSCGDQLITWEDTKLEVKVPRGTYPGDTIVLKDQGSQQPFLGNSDLVITIVAKPHPYLEAIPHSPDLRLHRLFDHDASSPTLTQGLLCKDGVMRGVILPGR